MCSRRVHSAFTQCALLSPSTRTPSQLEPLKVARLYLAEVDRKKHSQSHKSRSRSSVVRRADQRRPRASAGGRHSRTTSAEAGKFHCTVDHPRTHCFGNTAERHPPVVGNFMPIVRSRGLVRREGGAHPRSVSSSATVAVSRSDRRDGYRVHRLGPAMSRRGAPLSLRRMRTCPAWPMSCADCDF